MKMGYIFSAVLFALLVGLYGVLFQSFVIGLLLGAGVYTVCQFLAWFFIARGYGFSWTFLLGPEAFFSPMNKRMSDDVLGR